MIADLPILLLVQTLCAIPTEFVLWITMEYPNVSALPILSELMIAADPSVSLMLIVSTLD
jgi:hypothetical protein